MIKIFILERGGVECHISELFSLSKKGLVGGDLKSLLRFKGTRQDQKFNLEDIKRAMHNKNISDLWVTIIEKYKINFKIKDTPFSLTLKYSEIPNFNNSRLKNPKECWGTLCDFSMPKNEHGLHYSPTLKNHLKDLRAFFGKIKASDSFEIFHEIDYTTKKDGKIKTQEYDSKPRSKGIKETFVRPLFRIKAIDNEYNFNESDKY